MTLETFLEKLEQTPRDWYVVEADSLIRCGTGHFYRCPVAAVAGKNDVAYPLEYAKTIGLDAKLANEIVEAADSDKFNPELRAKLLKACGL